MMKNFIILISFLFIANGYSAQMLQNNNWHDFEGEISSQPVVLSLFLFENGEIKGNYFYKQNQIKIQFTGKLIEDNVQLTDTKQNTFKIKILDSNPSDEETDFIGQFFDTANNTKTELNFLLKSYSEGKYEHRYVRFEATDEQVENFAKQVLNAILTDDKNWLKNNCYYPLMVEFDNSAFGSIVNKEEFVKQYSVFVTKEMKNDIKKARTLNMEYDKFAGAIIGVNYNKYITINEFPNPNTKKLSLIISSITHY